MFRNFLDFFSKVKIMFLKSNTDTIFGITRGEGERGKKEEKKEQCRKGQKHFSITTITSK